MRSSIFEQERKLFAEVKNLSKGEMPKLYGIVSYDTALPQSWLDEAADRLSASQGLTRDEAYQKILWGTLWCYEKPDSVFGRPFYTYKELDEVMKEVLDLYL